MSTMEERVQTELKRMRSVGVLYFFSHHVHIIAANLVSTNTDVYTAVFSLAQYGIITMKPGRHTKFEYTGN